MKASDQISVGSDAGNTGAGAVVGLPRPPFFVPVPDDLRPRIESCLALARAALPQLDAGTGPANFRFADDALLSILSLWKEQLPALQKQAHESLPSPLADLLPRKGTCYASFILDFVVLDFPMDEKPERVPLNTLITILSNALQGSPNLMAQPEPPPVIYPPRRFCRRWWKERFQALFRACAIRCAASAPAPDAPAVLLLSGAGVQPAPAQAAPSQAHAEPICNAS
jgi:hypothetical protein